MKFNKLGSLVVLAASINDVTADREISCYGGLWMEDGQLQYHAHRACKGYDGKQGACQGTFKPMEKKRACVNQGLTEYISMEVQNLNGGASFDLNDADCAKEMSAILNACSSRGVSQGGTNTQAGWYFRCVQPSEKQ